MRTRRTYYKSKIIIPARKISTDRDGLQRLQPHVKLNREKLPEVVSVRQWSKERRRKEANRRQVEAVVPPSQEHRKADHPILNHKKPVDPFPPKNRPPAKLVKSDTTIHAESATRGAYYHRNNDMVLYGIDMKKKCYAIEIFPTPFDPNKNSFDDHLTLSIDKATELYKSLSLGICGDKQYPQISRCDDVSPFELAIIAKRLIYEVTMEKMHVREQQLRDFNKRIVEAMDEFRLHDCMHALDELILLTRHWLIKLIFKKQPRIVCTLLDLANLRLTDCSDQPMDEHSGLWSVIKSATKLAIIRIKAVFEFDGNDKDFQKWFLTEIELFTEMTAHLTDREKFELICDPVVPHELGATPIVLEE